MKNLRYLFVHLGWHETAIDWFKGIVNRHRGRGFDIVSFCAVPDPPAPRYSFQVLDRLWKKRDPKVVWLYRTLVKMASECDVLINFNGANIHPEWLKDLPTFNVYVCWDDPESSDELSRPVAKYFDFAFTGNIACVPLYRSWGIERSDYLPYACYKTEFDHSMTIERILKDTRDIDIVFLGERISLWRRERLDQLKAAFPQALMRGRGWPEGFLPFGQKLPLYSRAKIGWNMHNSVGPVNLRCFALPANGILQICDNKCRLGQIFDLGKEAIGFDTIEECIELTHYFLTHDKERRQIAARGYERVMRDYTEEKQWDLLLNIIAPYVALKKVGKLDTAIYQTTYSSSSSGLFKCKKFAKKVVKRCLREVGLEKRRIRKSPKSTCGNNDCHINTSPDSPYVENAEIGPVNWAEKEKRLKKGECFEWPNMVALNWAVASLVGAAKRIVELGGGTGCFAYEAAADPSRFILCTDLDNQILDWARKNRTRSNIQYIARIPTKEDGPFDLVVAIDVIEHVKDYRAFLEVCVSLAPRAIITTPNKNRDSLSAIESPPKYHQHIREWTAGEFYWVLKTFYHTVRLYSMPNVYIPQAVSIQITEAMTPLIAICAKPYNIENQAKGRTK